MHSHDSIYALKPSVQTQGCGKSCGKPQHSIIAHTQGLFLLPTHNIHGLSYRLQQKAIVKTINASQLRELQNSDRAPLLIDVRKRDEPKEKHLGGLWIPLDELLSQPPALPNDRPIVLYCSAGIRSYKAAQFLATQYPEADIYSLSSKS